MHVSLACSSWHFSPYATRANTQVLTLDIISCLIESTAVPNDQESRSLDHLLTALAVVIDLSGSPAGIPDAILSPSRIHGRAVSEVLAIAACFVWLALTTLLG